MYLTGVRKAAHRRGVSGAMAEREDLTRPEGPPRQREQHKVGTFQNWRSPHNDKGQQY